MKKITSMLLALVMCLSLCVPAVASESTDSLVQNNVCKIKLDDKTTLVVQDLGNGDSFFAIEEDGANVYTAYVERSSGSIQETDYQDVTPVTTISNYRDAVRAISSASPRYSYTNVGKVSYKLYDPPSTKVLSFAYYQNTSQSKYNINEKIQNLAALGAVLALVFNLPGTVAGAMAITVFGWLGYASTATALVFQNVMVNCNETLVDWKITDSGGYSTNFSGSKYVLTDDKHSGDIHYSGDYWAPNSYSQRDTNFAFFAYEYIYNSRDSATLTWG